MKLILLAIFSIALAPVRAEFALKDGDTVVFLGDSITAARQYTKLIETYTLLRFPDRKIRFVNAGKGGETARLSLDRLEQAVFAENPTVLTVAYGVNDIGWGMKADEAHKNEYLQAIGKLIDRCKERGIRLFICSAAITAEDPDKAETGFLQKMCDEGLALARSKGAGAIDVQRTMRAIQRRVLAHNAKLDPKAKPATLHTEDGVHLNELGQLAMGFAILKGLGAPAQVSSATVDATSGKIEESTLCQITAFKRSDPDLTFDRLDERLPLNLEPLWPLHGMFIPFSDELNQYNLTVRNLPPGQYEITANDRSLGSWSAEALHRGVNLASATADPWVPGGPWDAQAHTLKTLTDIRDDLVFARRGLNTHLTSHPHLDNLTQNINEIEKSIITLQHQVTQPFPAKFLLHRKNENPSPVQ